MVKAQQVERDGTKHGPVRTFTAAHWRRMMEIYGKKLRWERIGDAPKELMLEEVEYPKINDAESDSENSGDYIKSFDFDNMTKKMIISKYNLTEEDIKLKREILILKVLKLFNIESS